MRSWFQIGKFQTQRGDWYIEYSIKHYPGMNERRSHWKWIINGLGNGLLPDSTKLLPVSVKVTDQDLGRHMVTLGHNELKSHGITTWWRHQMETFSALLAICAGNSPVNSPHKGQWRGALMFSLICAWINGWVNNHEAGDLRRHRAHYDVTVILHVIMTHLNSISLLCRPFHA